MSETLYIPVSREGETGPVRGKLQVSVINALGADHGDLIEFTTKGKGQATLRVLTKAQARAARAEQERARKKNKAPKKSQTVKKEAVVKRVKQAPAKPVKPQVQKPNKRATKVIYETAPKKAAPVKKKFRVR